MNQQATPSFPPKDKISMTPQAGLLARPLCRLQLTGTAFPSKAQWHRVPVWSRIYSYGDSSGFSPDSLLKQMKISSATFSDANIGLLSSWKPVLSSILFLNKSPAYIRLANYWLKSGFKLGFYRTFSY